MSDEYDQLEDPQRLSQINTLWSVVRRAHGTETAVAQLAKRHLIDRYGTAIRRYLLGALRDATEADEVYQNFAVQFLEGRLALADHERGKFRSFLKTVLSRSIAEHHRKRGRDRLVQGAANVFDVADSTGENEAFDRSWRDVLLARTWDALAAGERRSERPLYSILRARVENPDASSLELAGSLSRQLGRTLTSTHLRVWLHRAREAFARLLIEEVEQSLDAADRETVEQELADLRLLEYCRPALERSRSD